MTQDDGDVNDGQTPERVARRAFLATRDAWLAQPDAIVTLPTRCHHPDGVLDRHGVYAGCLVCGTWLGMSRSPEVGYLELLKESSVIHEG